MSGDATRVVLSFPDGLSEWGRDQIDTDRYRNYLRRVIDEARVGDPSRGLEVRPGAEPKEEL